MDEEKLTKLNESVDRLNHNLERQISLKFLIVRGFVYGISFVVGTTILAGIAISILNKTFGSAENIPIFGNFVDEIPNQ